jgi:hypothetical protein
VSGTQRPNLIDMEAFSVEVLGRTGLRYVENGKSMFVDSEVLATPGALVVYSNTITNWEPPDEFDPLDADERTRILNNIREAFQSKGFALEVM